MIEHGLVGGHTRCEEEARAEVGILIEAEQLQRRHSHAQNPV
jgi:hypothetical protein